MSTNTNTNRARVLRSYEAPMSPRARARAARQRAKGRARMDAAHMDAIMVNWAHDAALAEAEARRPLNRLRAWARAVWAGLGALSPWGRAAQTKAENEAFEVARRRECGPDVNHGHNDSDSE